MPSELLDNLRKQRQTPTSQECSQIPVSREETMTGFVQRLWQDEAGQDIAEYAVMLAVILVLVVGTIRLIGGNANNVFSQTASSIGQ